MLLGIRRRLARRLLAEGWRVRIYVPFGRYWLPYTLRRLREHATVGHGEEPAGEAQFVVEVVLEKCEHRLAVFKAVRKARRPRFGHGKGGGR